MHFIGIDLGGTKVSGALFDSSGEILVKDQLLLEGRSGDQAGELIISLCKSICKLGGIQESDPKSIGVCVPGISYSKTGRVWAPNIKGWDDYPLQAELMDNIPNSRVTIESDRTCYILGEQLRGVAKGCDNAVFMAVGTGIGGGILVDGNVLHGNSDIIGALGWMALKPPYDNDWDACGCFESHASGPGLAMQTKKMLKNSGEYSGILRSYDVEKITSYELFDAYFQSDPIAVRVIDQAVELWGMAAANLVSIFNPQMVIFGGGVFGPAVPLIPKIYEEAKKWAQPISIKEVLFKASAVPNMAGLYGAGAVAVRTGSNIINKKL